LRVKSSESSFSLLRQVVFDALQYVKDYKGIIILSAAMQQGKLGVPQTKLLELSESQSIFQLALGIQIII